MRPGPNPRKCRRFSHTRKQLRRDRTGWLGCQDSNLGMAESKSTCFAFDFKDHSEKLAKFDPFPFNRLGADSECEPYACAFCGRGCGDFACPRCWPIQSTVAPHARTAKVR